MVFSRAESKPSEGVTFDLSDNDNLKPSILSTMDYYHGADLRPAGFEYPEGYLPRVQPTPQTMEVQAGPAEVIEEELGLNIRDNGLGIMVADYPETEPSASAIQDEAESIAEFTSETVLYKTPISYKKLAASGLKRVAKAVKSAGSTVTDKYYGANAVIANTVTGIHSVGEKLSKLESKTNRSRIIKGIGGLALLGVASYATYRGISLLESSHSHQAAHETAQQLLPSKAPHSLPEAIHHQPHQATATVPHQPRLTTAANHIHHPIHRVETLDHPGDTIYNHVHQRVLAKYHNLSQQKIKQLTDHFSVMTVKLNHLSDWQVHRMKVGQKFKDLSWLS
jgi:hypothetical protein